MSLRARVSSSLVGPGKPLDSVKLRAWLRKRLTTVSNSPRPGVRKGYVLGRQAARRVGYRLTGRQFGWVAMVREARWTGPTTFTFAGWAYERGFGYPDGPPRTRIWFQSGSMRVEADVEQVVNHEANGGITNAAFDYANTGYRASVDVAALHAHLPSRPGRSRRWVAVVQVLGPDGSRRQGRFSQRERLGSPRHMPTHTLDDGSQVVPAFDARDGGLSLTTTTPVVAARDLTLSGRQLRGTLVSAVALVAARVLTDDQERPLDLARDDHPAGAGPAAFRYTLSGTVPLDKPPSIDEVQLSVTRNLVALGADGARHLVASDLDEAPPEVFAGSELMIASGARGQVAILDAPARVLVDRWSLDTDGVPCLRLEGRYLVSHGASGSVPSLAFVGSRQVLPVEVEMAPGAEGRGTWSGTACLHVAEWGRRPLPARQGAYVLRGELGGEAVPVSAVPELSGATPTSYLLEGFRLILQSGAGRSVRFRVSPPRKPDELGSFHQRRLERHYLGRPHEAVDAVYFESFYGRGATCNPRAIDAEIARTHPDLRRYWGVVDAATPVPEGAVPVLRGTRAWWEARASARWVVANDWLRRQFEPQPFQVVLQTWHGSMLKRIGLDRPKVPADKRRVIEVERAKWDLLLSQNKHSTDILRTAYAWDGPILEEGYPRNDPLTSGSVQAGDGAAIRAALGIAPGQRAILYAPTWRENMTEMVTFLDLERLAAALGPDHVVLLRGHSRTVAFGSSVRSMPGVIDVTTYPEVTDLFLAADALVTDYSSVMFDYSVTRRPMIFFVPDMDAYRDSLRGVYFDLSEVAPGPVLADQDGVAEAILDLDAAGDRYAALYERWVARFNHHDDGHSSERVAKELLSFEK